MRIATSHTNTGLIRFRAVLPPEGKEVETAIGAARAEKPKKNVVRRKERGVATTTPPLDGRIARLPA
jgi:hypothetical protein